jgi:succinate-semialdehyde dehydrogenase/glutarate-semialdehyde dehydrogenase
VWTEKLLPVCVVFYAEPKLELEKNYLNKTTFDYPELYMIIDGERVSVAHRRSLEVINPATETVLGLLPVADESDLDRALEAAARGFQLWRKSSAQERARVLQQAAELMLERQDELAWIATLEEGKTLAEARAEVMMNVGLFNFYAGECQRLYGRALVRPHGQRSIVSKVPVGPVAAFSAWNFPLGNPGRKLGAPIAAGCSVIMKAAEEAPASALGVLQCLLDAGLPGSVAQAVFGIPDEVSRHCIASPVIRKISFTGSTSVGKHLVRLAAEDMKTTTMELGGHGPVIVCDDVDINAVLDVMVPHKFRNAGQVCVASTRFIVQDGIYDEFIAEFTLRTRAIRVGNGLESGVQMGPMANGRGPENIDLLIKDAIAQGATLHCGGHPITGAGFFYAPTVLSGTPITARILNEEPFGPVALINRFESDQQAIDEANRLPYGLAAYVWVNDSRRQRSIANEIEAGMVGVNTINIAGADSPFCGVKWSGHGAENGPEGLDACLITRSIHEA